MGEVVGYARVSTSDQSLEVQLEQLNADGADRVYREKISGVRADRPALNEMLDYVRSGDTVVCCKLDRIARSTKNLLEIVEQLEAKGVSFKVLNINLDTSTPTGKLMLTMLGAIATFEREMMLERQAEGIATTKQEGRYTGGRKPTAMAKAQEVIELLAQGMTEAAVARQLNIGVASVYRIIKSSRQ